MALTKGFARNNAKTPLDQRLADMATIVGNADGSPRTGVLGGASAAIVSALATWHFRVQAAEFVTSKGKADGVMIFTNDGVVDVPIAAGAPASNSRIDVLWVKHEDNTTGDAASLPIFGVTSGAAAASPVKPAIPTGAEELATLRAYSGTTGASGGANVLANTYRMTAARGAVVPFRSKAELDLWTTATLGQRAHTMDTGVTHGREAAGWSPTAFAVTARKGSPQALTATIMADVLSVNIPADAPAGRYRVLATVQTWCPSATTHFKECKWGATTLDGTGDGSSVVAGQEFYTSPFWLVDHPGGAAVTVTLRAQVNAATANCGAGTRLLVEFIGKV